MTGGSQECLSMLREVRPNVVVGDACRRFEGVREKEGISGATSLARLRRASFYTRMFEQPSANDGMERRDSPALERESYIVDKAEILAS